MYLIPGIALRNQI